MTQLHFKKWVLPTCAPRRKGEHSTASLLGSSGVVQGGPSGAYKGYPLYGSRSDRGRCRVRSQSHRDLTSSGLVRSLLCLTFSLKLNGLFLRYSADTHVSVSLRPAFDSASPLVRPSHECAGSVPHCTRTRLVCAVMATAELPTEHDCGNSQVVSVGTTAREIRTTRPYYA